MRPVYLDLSPDAICVIWTPRSDSRAGAPAWWPSNTTPATAGSSSSKQHSRVAGRQIWRVCNTRKPRNGSDGGAVRLLAVSSTRPGDPPGFPATGRSQGAPSAQATRPLHPQPPCQRSPGSSRASALDSQIQISSPASNPAPISPPPNRNPQEALETYWRAATQLWQCARTLRASLEYRWPKRKRIMLSPY